MTPKEKAEELFDKVYIYTDDAKSLALICVDEILKSTPFGDESIYSLWDMPAIKISKAEQYWQEVKQELNKL